MLETLVHVTYADSSEHEHNRPSIAMTPSHIAFFSSHHPSQRLEVFLAPDKVESWLAVHVALDMQLAP